MPPLILLKTVSTADPTLSALERSTVQKLLKGELATLNRGIIDPHAPSLLTQKAAADLLGVRRITIRKMSRDAALHPVEVIPGSWRYPYHEIMAIAQGESLPGRTRTMQQAAA